MSEAPSWQHMWGATVRMPCDMEDDILEDVIQVVTRRLKEFDADGWEKCGSTVSFSVRFIPRKGQKQYSLRSRFVKRSKLI